MLHRPWGYVTALLILVMVMGGLWAFKTGSLSTGFIVTVPLLLWIYLGVSILNRDEFDRKCCQIRSQEEERSDKGHS